MKLWSYYSSFHLFLAHLVLFPDSYILLMYFLSNLKLSHWLYFILWTECGDLQTVFHSLLYQKANWMLGQ
jgi:hypothetical protein